MGSGGGNEGTLGSATGEPGTVTADGTVRVRAKFTKGAHAGGEDFHFERGDGTTGSMIDPTGTTMTGEVNGAGVADYDQIFTKQ